ncbi:unnamed protein product [Orchesella dallaii]|uniref:E3 ubiquitin-protein ligase n=1 Tax=Orchesella dallaii TaxID=48710 RepID=A0ABP1RWH7_9HEXA
MEGFFNPFLRPIPTSIAQDHHSYDSIDDAITPTCRICYQYCLYPIELPCRHKFCFMCIKGQVLAHNLRHCPLCRVVFPMSVINYPVPIVSHEIVFQPNVTNTRRWYYESRSGGWWQYDRITMSKVEEAYNNRQREPCIPLRIAGIMYQIDFNRMIQYRSGYSHIFRRITFGPVTNVKGIAGILFHDQETFEGANRVVPPPQIFRL